MKSLCRGRRRRGRIRARAPNRYTFVTWIWSATATQWVVAAVASCEKGGRPGAYAMRLPAAPGSKRPCGRPVTQGFSRPGSVKTKSLRDASRQPTGASTYRASGLRLLATTERLETELFISHRNLSNSQSKP